MEKLENATLYGKFNKIKFYRANDLFGVFSNFDTKHPITLKGVIWPTTEHYFQAQKFVGTIHEANVRRSDSPSRAAAMGRDRSLPLRSDWESVKDDVMRKAVIAKISQHKDVRETLLLTENAELIEHTTNDSYWADGGDGSGKNMLGIILMEVREKIRKSALWDCECHDPHPLLNLNTGVIRCKLCESLMELI